ncbi:MAG: ABC transporter ATP-binding protein [Verrucomicrobiota bacterium]
MPGDATARELHLEGKNLHRSFQIGDQSIHVLKGVSLQVHQGERLFLCGASGAGKTSLLYTLAGLEAPNEGTVLIQGNSLYDEPAHRQAKLRNQLMGYVFQNYFLLPELTALENVMMPAMIAGKSAEERATLLLSEVGLDQRVHHLPNQLSGGEQQRVAIARALINDPQMIFADEPTGNLDSRSGEEVMRILFDMAGREKRTLLIVTHDQSLASSGDRTLFLADGMLVN